jgi:hypothetical protein
MLKALVGQRVLVVETRSGRSPMVVGSVFVYASEFIPADKFDEYRDYVCIAEGSKYDCRGKGKWFYHVTDPIPCEPFPLPADRVNHGRSYCEVNVEINFHDCEKNS